MIGVSVLLVGLSIIMLIHAFIRAKNAAFYVANDCTCLSSFFSARNMFVPCHWNTFRLPSMA